MPPPAKRHVVHVGESLSSIAKKYNVSSWKLIYYATVNDGLRLKRPNPQQIQPNDLVLIPPNLRDVLKSRLARLEELRSICEKSYLDQKASLAAELQKINAFGTELDLAAVLVSAVAGIVATTRLCYNSLKMTGTALAELNQSVLQGALKSKGSFTFPIAVGAPGLSDLVTSMIGSTTSELTGNEGLVWALTRISVETMLDAFSPSFWARAIATKSINPPSTQKMQSEATAALEAARKSLLANLDGKIFKTRQLLSDYEAQLLVLVRTA